MINLYRRAVAGVFFLSAAAVAYAQAPLDVYNSFVSEDIPQGWIYNLSVNDGNLFYYGGSDDSPSARLDATGEFLRLEFAESPSEVSYYIRSTGFGNPVSPGTVFTVQQSIDGSNWDDLQVFGEDNLTGGFVYHSHNMNPMARYLRFYYTQKMSGSNIAIDEVSLSKAAATPSARMMLRRDGEKVLSGHRVYMSESTGLNIQVENEGLSEELEVLSYTLTGPDASHFQVEQVPGQLPALGSGELEVSLNGDENEVYYGLLSMVTNDQYNPTYTVFITGYGGAYAPNPETVLSDFSVDDLSTYGFNLSWSATGPAPDYYVVLQATGSPGAEDPADGLGLDRSHYVQNSRVVYIGTETQFRAQNIGTNSTYYYRVLAANGQGQYTNYKQEGVIETVVTTPPDMIQDYYTGLSVESANFVNELNELVFPHTQIDYYDYPNTLIAEFEARDTTENRKVVTGYYAGYEHVYEGEFSWNVLSREHVFPHSWFPTYQAFDEVEYTDFHNLFPVHNDSANMPRLNHPFAVVESEVETFLQGKLGWSSNGDFVYEPRDFAKGRAARAVFYMTTCYNNQIGGSWTLPNSQDQQLLKDWHFAFPPDSREKARNDYLYHLQGNRNPFIDNVHYACYIDFDDMTYIQNPEQWCINLSVKDKQGGIKPQLYPNPNKGWFTLNWNNELAGAAVSITLTNTSGQQLWEKVVNPEGVNRFNVADLPAGYYILSWYTDSASGQVPMVIQP